ncbi:hypothetical protein GVAV_001835 [Gurleya vavrai]
MKTKTNKLSNELKKIIFGHERYDLIFLENSLISEVDFGILQNHLLNFYPFNSFDTNTLFVFVFKFDDLTKTHDFTNKFLTKVEPNYQNFYWSKKNFNKRSKLEKNNKKNCIFYEIKHKSQLNFANNIDSQSNLENNFEFTRKCFPYKIKIPNTTSSVFWVFTYELIFPTLNDNFYPFKKIKNSIGSRIYNLCFKNACNEINFYILEIDSFQEFTNFSMVCTKIKSDIFISDSLESFDACLYLYQKSNKIFYLRDNTVETDRTTNKELFLRNLNNLLLKAKFINYRIPPAFSFIIRSDLMLINPRLLSTYTKQISFLKFFETLELFVQHFNSKKYKKIFSVEFFAVYYDPLMFFCKQQPDSKQNFNHLNYIKCEKFPVETLKKYETFCYKISLTKQNVIYSIYLSLEIKFEDYNSIFDKNKITVFKMIEKKFKKDNSESTEDFKFEHDIFSFCKKVIENMDPQDLFASFHDNFYITKFYRNMVLLRFFEYSVHKLKKANNTDDHRTEKNYRDLQDYIKDDPTKIKRQAPIGSIIDINLKNEKAIKMILECQRFINIFNYLFKIYFFIDLKGTFTVEFFRFNDPLGDLDDSVVKDIIGFFEKTFESNSILEN